MGSKRRLSVTVDDDAARAGEEAVGAGLAPSLSAWVNDALHARAERDRRLRALDEFLDDYEREFGAFDEAELAAIERRSRASAVVVRGPGIGPHRTGPDRDAGSAA